MAVGNDLEFSCYNQNSYITRIETGGANLIHIEHNGVTIRIPISLGLKRVSLLLFSIEVLELQSEFLYH